MISVYCHNNQHNTAYPHGTSLMEVAKAEGIVLKYPLLGALVNNKVRDMNYLIHKPCQIRFFDGSSAYGNDMYKRSLYFMLFKVVSDLLPNVKLRISHSISGGKYCALDGYKDEIDDALINRLTNAMRELVARDIPFRRLEMLTPDALAEYSRHGMDEKSRLFKYRKRIYTTIYALDDKINYYYGFLVPSTGYIKLFSLEKYESGLLLKMPQPKHPDSLSATRSNPKLFSIYRDYKEGAIRYGVPYVMDINERIVSGEIGDVVRVTEAIQENRFARIAADIRSREKVKLVMISGPSSSGKTTTCKRISVQLAIQGYWPVQVSVDDFFVEREQTPKDKDGKLDFEALEAIDLKLFNDTLLKLMDGQEVELPTFDFQQGKKLWLGKKVQMKENSILIIEGIHCLNPKLTEAIPDEVKYRIFVSALTSISIDSQNPIPTTDNRLIRRIVRDHKYRGYSALDTLRRWQSVRNGESKNIFPYQENADAMVNSALIYELGILKPYAVPVLNEVPETEPEYAEARRLLKLLSYFKSITPDMIPGTSILREFVGGSQFSY